jgi:hypothetical protein
MSMEKEQDSEASRPGCLTPGIHPPIPIGQEAGWASEPVWTPCRRGKVSCPYQEPKPISSENSPSLYRLSYPGSKFSPYNLVNLRDDREEYIYTAAFTRTLLKIDYRRFGLPFLSATSYDLCFIRILFHDAISRLLVKKTELTAGGIRCADHATHSIRKNWH